MRTLLALVALLVALTASGLAGSAAHAQPAQILTNHLGYELDAPKHAVIRGRNNDRVTAFRVVREETGATVLAGTPRAVGPVRRWEDWYFWTIDFDRVTRAGSYHLEATTNAGTLRSFPFLVQKNVLERNTLSDVIAYFKGQRSSGLRDKADRRVPFEGNEDRRIDAHGGWFDATGDYGKHLSHLSFSTYFNPQQISLTAWALFRTYEILDERGDPNFREYKRRLLDEALFGADYLVRVKDPNGSFYRSVSAPGPEKKPEDRRIARAMRGFAIRIKPSGEVDPETATGHGGGPIGSAEQAYEVGYRAGGGAAIAALARAATFDVSGDFTTADYLKAAEDAFAFLEANNLHLTNDGRGNIVDDYTALLAAVELFKVTGKPAYKQAADRRARSLTDRLISTDAYRNYWRADDGDRPFFHAADAGFPVVSLMEYVKIADAATRRRVLGTVEKSLRHELEITREVANPFGYSRQVVQHKDGRRRTTFFYPHDAETAPWWQGENARLASMATAARLAAPYFPQDPAFQRALHAFALDQLNWILGLNPYDASMLYGTGRNNPEYLFFGNYEYQNMPGGISNGITAGLTDEDGIAYAQGFNVTGKDEDWRWTEQWLPHATWYMLAVALGSQLTCRRGEPAAGSAREVNRPGLARRLGQLSATSAAPAASSR